MATTQRRSRPAATKKTVAAKKTPVLLELTSTPDESDEREPFFSINGREYTIRVEVPANVALEYLITAAEDGAGAAIVFALNYALGPEARRALMTHRGLTKEQLGKVIGAVRAKFDGAVADLKALPSGE